MCNVVHSGITILMKNEMAIRDFYFAGFNVDGPYLEGLIKTLVSQAGERAVTISYACSYIKVWFYH